MKTGKLLSSGPPLYSSIRISLSIGIVGSNEFLTMSSSNAVPTVSVNSVGMRKGR